MRRPHSLIAVSCICLSWLALTTHPHAQSGFSILSPAPNARLKAGPDFATDVLGDPWDMSNADDISPDPAQLVGWSSFGFTGQNEVGGTTTSSAASFALMSPGFLGGLNSGRTGLRYPIDSATYSQVSFRLKMPQGHVPRVYWYHNAWLDPAGLAYGVRFADTSTGGYQIFRADLTTNLAAGLPWTAGVVRSLRFDPTFSNTPIQALFDWVRLTVPDSHPAAVKQTITWTGAGGPVTLTVIDAGGTAYTIASGVTGSSYTWSYGFLPPGAYTLRITSGIQTVSQPFTINAPPIVHLTDPDETGGEDFATKVLGNPWDMNDASDIRTVPDDHVPQKSYSNGILSGVSDGVITNYYGTAPGGDAQLFLLTGNATVDPNRYRYLTVRMRVDDPFDLLGGSIGRVLWGSKANQPYSLTVSREWLVWPGWNTYTFDLGSLNTSTYGGIVTTEGNKLPWTAAPITSLRIDPHEFAQLKGFQIDYVKLAAVDEAKGSFVIRWTGGDPDNNPTTVALYYDTNRNVGDGATFIGTANGTAAQYVWNTSGVPPGTYWIYAVATDGLNTTASYSTGPVKVLSGAAASDPLVAIDTPTTGTQVLAPFTVSGWIIDRTAVNSSGIDGVQALAYAAGSTTPVDLGAVTYGTPRPDVATAYGAQFGSSGYHLVVSSLPSGNYRIVIKGHSTVANAWNASAAIDVSVLASKVLVFDGPVEGSISPQPFTLSGTALDATAASGTGVSAVHVYAYPSGSATPSWSTVATLGDARPAIGSLYGSRFTASGFHCSVVGLPPGTYRFVAYGLSTSTASFSLANAITLGVASHPAVAFDAPAPGASVNQVFTISGWAADFAAASGTGVDAVTITATRVGTSTALPLGSATYGQSRPDVGAAFGARFTPTGYSLRTSLPAGSYDVAVSARSTLTGGTLATVRNRIVVRPSVIRGVIDTPGNGAVLSGPFGISGWAIDTYAASGTGIDAIHAWAYPTTGGGAPVFIGVMTYGLARPAVAQQYGAQFTNSGFALSNVTLPSGTWTISLFAASTATQSFAGAGAVTVSVP